jgi:putative oxygen-independent coproporphyrinogen III oxidase
MADAVALYVHWPYCARICPYCDFNVTRDRGQAFQRVLFDAMLSDLRAQAEMIGPRELVSIFFGGGTPSLLPPQWVADLIEVARRLFLMAPDLEISLEANPTDAETARFTALREAGVNRLSLGVQALNDDALRFLGRNHSAREALAGIETAQSVFGRVSVDLIYALPDQSAQAWEAELKRAITLGAEHLSPYQLTIEQTTAFGRAVRRGQWSPPKDDLAERLYFVTQDVLESEGFDAYEISNHAKGMAAQARHNVHIWRGVDYIGIGPGAHGRLTLNGVRTATEAASDLRAYVAQVNATGMGHESTHLSLQEAEEEAVMLGLRMAEGVALNRASSLDLTTRAQSLIEQGFVDLSPTHLRATAKGRVVLDRLLFELLS